MKTYKQYRGCSTLTVQINASNSEKITYMISFPQLYVLFELLRLTTKIIKPFFVLCQYINAGKALPL